MIEEGRANILMDTQEQKRFNTILKRLQPVNVKITPLRTGDFLISGERGTLLIERKSLLDFAHSISSGQLIKELKQMYEELQDPNVKRLVLIEGSIKMLFRAKLKWNLNELMMVMATLPFAWNINLMWIEDPRMIFSVIYSFARYLGKPREPPKIYGSRPKRKLRSMEEKQRFLLEGIPGVGGQIADKFLMSTGTPMNFFVLVQTKTKIPGLGEKKKSDIIDLLTAHYRPEKKKER